MRHPLSVQQQGSRDGGMFSVLIHLHFYLVKSVIALNRYGGLASTVCMSEFTHNFRDGRARTWTHGIDSGEASRRAADSHPSSLTLSRILSWESHLGFLREWFYSWNFLAHDLYSMLCSTYMCMCVIGTRFLAQYLTLSILIFFLFNFLRTCQLEPIVIEQMVLPQVRYMTSLTAQSSHCPPGFCAAVTLLTPPPLSESQLFSVY